MQVGFDREVRVEVEARGAAGAPSFEWRQIGGPDVGASMRPDGGRLVFRTRPLSDFVAEPIRPGVIAIPASAAVPYRFRVRVKSGAEQAEGTVEVTAALPSNGARGVPVDTDVHLAGPADQTAWLWTAEGRTTEADVAMDLRDADTRFPVLRQLVFDDVTVREAFSGTEIRLFGGEWERFECGSCHEKERLPWQGTRHATVLERGLLGLMGPAYREECLACHAVGWAPGVESGGFDDVAFRARWRFPTERGADAAKLPPELSRLAGVGCVACHGPGRFTPARMDAGMCASCHDRPPEYTTVAEWRRSGMARPIEQRPDAPAVVRPCTRCHSTQGFIQWTHGASEVDPPKVDDAEPITCAACHDPHDGRRPHQLRAFGPGPLGAGAVCVPCHTGAHAPQADVLAGSVHAELPGSCVACHRPHTFAAARDCSPAECAACHAEPGCGDAVRKAVDAHMTAALRRDGSHGAHNPAWARKQRR